jgi:hypothetical protein
LVSRHDRTTPVSRLRGGHPTHFGIRLDFELSQGSPEIGRLQIADAVGVQVMETHVRKRAQVLVIHHSPDLLDSANMDYRQPRFAALMDLRQARAARSFDKLYREVGRLLAR